MAILQSATPKSAPLALVGTFFLTAAFYALTAHVAARWVLGETPLASAVEAGLAPAVVTVGLLDFVHPGLVAGLAIAADAVALRFVYGESPKTTGIFAVVHVLVSAALGIALLNLVGLLA